MKKIKLFAVVMGIIMVFAFTGCTSDMAGSSEGTTSGNISGTSSTDGRNGAYNKDGIVSDIGRMLDGNDSAYNDAIRETPLKPGIHTNPEYSGVAYGGGYANIGK